MQKLKSILLVVVVAIASLHAKAQQTTSVTPKTSKVNDKTITTSGVDNMPIVSPTVKMEMPCLTIYLDSNIPVLSEEKKKSLEEKLNNFCARKLNLEENEPEFLKNLRSKKRTGMDIKLAVE